jgi:hypothetical protein
MSEFRSEIVETSKTRSDFLKWKLIGAAGLGAVGLGVTTPASIAGSYLVLALIPLVCFYVDMICRHTSLRILVIGRFLRLQGAGEQAAYEAFAQLSREQGVFGFEDLALLWSTVLLSGLIFLLGLLRVAPGGHAAAAANAVLVWAGKQPIDVQELAPPLFMLSGVVGAALTTVNHLAYKQHIDRLNALVSDTNRMRTVRAMASKSAPTDPTGA